MVNGHRERQWTTREILVSSLRSLLGEMDRRQELLRIAARMRNGCPGANAEFDRLIEGWAEEKEV